MPDRASIARIALDICRFENIHAILPGIYTVINILAFLYQVSNGFSPFRVSVSSIYAQRCTKSSWLMTCVNFPVTARYTSSTTLKLVGKKISK